MRQPSRAQCAQHTVLSAVAQSHLPAIGGECDVWLAVFGCVLAPAGVVTVEAATGQRSNFIYRTHHVQQKRTRNTSEYPLARIETPRSLVGGLHPSRHLGE